MSDEQQGGQTGAAGEGQDTGQQFHIQKVYLKDASFETPGAPGIFTRDWDPKVDVELGTKGERVGEGVVEVVLHITVSAKVGEETAYLCEVQQAGIFTMQGFEQESMNSLVGSYCPQILFPYAREAISDLVAKGGFPQMLLAPVNFEAIYQQRLAQQQQDGEAQDTRH